MSIASPHFSATFEILQKGSKVVEQNSEGDLLARAKNVAVCPIGFREDVPEFGIPELLFKTVPLRLAEVRTEIARWAELDLSVAEHSEGLETAIRQVLAHVTRVS